MITTSEARSAEGNFGFEERADSRQGAETSRIRVSDSLLTSMLGRYSFMQLVIALTGLIRNKVVAVRLGAAEFGEITQILAVVGVIATLVTFGMRLSVSRNVARTADREEQQALLANANGLVLSLCLLSLPILTIALLTGRLLTIAGLSVSPEVLAATGLCLVAVPFMALTANYQSLLQGVLDVKGLTTQRSAAMVAALAFSVPLVWVFGLIGALASFLATSILLALLLGRRGHAMGFHMLSVHLDRQRIGLLASFGIASVLVGFASTLAGTSVRAALIAQEGAAANGMLQAPLVVATTLQTILLEGVGAMALTTVSIAKGQEETARAVRQLFKVVMPIAIAGLGILGLLAVPAIIILYSPEFVSGASYMPFILVNQLLLVVMWILGSPMLAAGDRLLWLVQDLIWVAVGWALSLALLPALEGRAIVVGTLVSSAGQFAMLIAIIRLRYRITIGARQMIGVAVGIALVGLLAVIGTSYIGSPAVLAIGAVAWGCSLVYCLYATPILPMIKARVGLS